MPQVSSIQSNPEEQKLPDEMTCEALWELEDKGERPTVIDIRDEEDWNKGHIDWATHLPLNRVESEAQQIFPDKNELIIACCSIGAESRKAVDKLKEMGYTNVKNLSGGYTGYCGLEDNPEVSTSDSKD